MEDWFVKYISLFAGIGGFDLALNRLGHVCVWANEWDKYAGQIYNKRLTRQDTLSQERQTKVGNTGNGYNETSRDSGHSISTSRGEGIDTRDITTISTSEIPDHDLLVGGFPCQAFSIAGKRRGFDDTRGTLFFEIARILKDKQPKFFILENVKGLLSHDNGNTFKTIITTLDELGYDLQWQVLNSKNFGVPQNRERVFIVGHIRGTSRPEVFPIGQDDNPLITKGGQQPSSTVISRTLTATDAKMHLDGNYVVGDYRYDEGIRIRKDNISPTIRQEMKGQDISKSVLLFSKEPKIRRLTPTECERLQGFPDGWTEGVSDTQRYKCLGNAVTVSVVYEIARRL